MTNLKLLEKTLEYSLIIISLLICTVLTMQYFFDIAPCKMCYFQRYPYYLILSLTPVIFLFKKFYRHLQIIVIVSLLTSGLIAAYHVAIERDLVDITPNCATNDADFSDANSLLEHLKTQKPVSCDIAGFKFILTLSEWNLLIALFLASYNLLGFRRSARAKQSNV